MKTLISFFVLTLIMTLQGANDAAPATTSTDWRDDGANLEIVRRLNEAYRRIPFSEEYEGVLDDRPLALEWSVGPNLPVAWKGGVAAILGQEIVLVGGLWMPGRKNLAYAYNLHNRTYKEIPPPPFETAYTQGAYEGTTLYLVGGRSAGRRAAALSRATDGSFKWTPLPDLLESEGQGRWLGTVGVVPGKWLLLVGGHPTGTPFEIRSATTLPDWRLRLDVPDAQWESMSPYPGSARALMSSGVIRGKLHVFGGSIADTALREVYLDLIKDYGLFIGPYKGVHDYRDSYRYDPEANTWQQIRNLPFGMSGGAGVVLKDRYILIMGSVHINLPRRVGKTDWARVSSMDAGGKAKKAVRTGTEPFWTGYDDRILCYDIEKDNYSRIGVMLYGVGTCPWFSDGKRLYGFGGEPFHGFNDNTENVLQIGTIQINPR